MKILVVSDSSDRWLQIAKILMEANYDPHLAEKTNQAIDLVSEMDLIIVDREISEDGVELCRELRCRGYERPLILMALESLNDVRVSGADDWLEVPLFAPEVALKVELLLNRYQLWNNQMNSSFNKTFCQINY